LRFPFRLLGSAGASTVALHASHPGHFVSGSSQPVSAQYLHPCSAALRGDGLRRPPLPRCPIP
jgi:hypothetical protein